MAQLSAVEIVELWEVGRLQHPLDRAITMLCFGCPGIDRSTLAGLTMGQRDALLFELREQMFGPRFDAFVECQACGERLELSLTSAQMRALPMAEAPGLESAFECEVAGGEISFRLPDSVDMAAAALCHGSQTARAALLQRCLLRARINGEDLPVHTLSDDVITRVVERMSECEPIADIVLNLDCPSCTARWQESFDISSFFWTEITVQAKRLLREVHTLASVYGWREAEILSLSAVRRNSYLEMVCG